MKGLLVKTNGSISPVDFEPPFYQSIRNIIDGYIEIVHPKGLHRPYCMVVDEEGLIKQKEINVVGSVLYETQKHGSPIVGDILILREVFDGWGWDFEGLYDEDVEQLTPQLTIIIETYEKHLNGGIK